MTAALDLPVRRWKISGRWWHSRERSYLAVQSLLLPDVDPTDPGNGREPPSDEQYADMTMHALRVPPVVPRSVRLADRFRAWAEAADRMELITLDRVPCVRMFVGRLPVAVVATWTAPRHSFALEPFGLRVSP